MEIVFTRRYGCNPVLLQIIIQCLYSAQTPTVCELQLSIFSEMRGIRIEKCACISERFNDEICSGYLACELGSFFAWIRDRKLEKRFDGEMMVFVFPACGFSAVIVY